MNGPAVGQADESQEQWNRVHAQLLKSVADAQARLLAAQNETNDRLVDTNREIISLNGKLESQAKEILGVNETLHRIRDRLDGFFARLDTMTHVLASLCAKTQAVGSVLKELNGPRRRIVKRAVERKR